jgi:hypothetical protein
MTSNAIAFATDTPVRRILNSRWYSAVSAVLVLAGFAAWMIEPVGSTVVLVAAYGCVVAGVALESLKTGVWMDRRLRWFFVASLFVGIFGAVHGFLAGNPGVQSETVFFVALPLVWLVIVFGMDLPLLRVVLNATPFVGLAIGLLGSLYWLDASGGADIPWITVIYLGQSYGPQAYGFGLTFYPLASLVFLLSFFFMSLIVRNTYTWRASRWVAWPATLSVFFLLFVSGRRALFVALILSVLIGFFIFFLGRSEVKTRRRLYWVLLAAAVLGAVATFLTKFSPAAMIQSVGTDLFSSHSVRARSGDALVKSWLQSPIIGHGLGALVPGSVRSKTRPWNFELQYHMMLNSLGVIGVAIFAVITVGLIIIAARAYRLNRVRFGFLAPVVAGSIALLIGDATDPYMHTPGQYWMFFILVVATNAVLREHRKAQESGPVPKASHLTNFDEAGEKAHGDEHQT